jgi:hypothetical protein
MNGNSKRILMPGILGHQLPNPMTNFLKLQKTLNDPLAAAGSLLAPLIE